MQIFLERFYFYIPLLKLIYSVFLYKVFKFNKINGGYYFILQNIHYINVQVSKSMSLYFRFD